MSILTCKACNGAINGKLCVAYLTNGKGVSVHDGCLARIRETPGQPVNPGGIPLWPEKVKDGTK